jgi:saxitoxin biosynthesis operon SxtJ-like protein
LIEKTPDEVREGGVVMQWADVIKPASDKTLRQFAALSLLVFGGMAAWRLWHGQSGAFTIVLLALALVIGGVGLLLPAAIRPIYAGWMIAAFPIGWAVSKIVMGLMFYLVFTPVGVLFRLMGRDPLQLRRRQAGSFWAPKAPTQSGDEYLRQY